MKMILLVAKYKHPESEWAGYINRQYDGFDLKYHFTQANNFEDTEKGISQAIDLIKEYCLAKKQNIEYCSLSRFVIEEEDVAIKELPET